MTKRFAEIGDRLRAYRIGSGISVQEVAERMGVSVAAVYRYEKGEIVKIETVERLGRLLKVPLSALMGMGIEHISNGLAFFERVRQIEESATSIIIMYGPVGYWLTSNEYMDVLEDELRATKNTDESWTEQDLRHLRETLEARKATFWKRRTSLVSIIAVSDIERFLATGLAARARMLSEQSRSRKSHAIREIRHLAGLVARSPMGIQIGLVHESLPTSISQIIRRDEGDVVVSSPFRIGDLPNIRVGIATINDNPNVVKLYEDLAQKLWSTAATGRDAHGVLMELVTKAEAELA
jgi:transcriptional regulator with XRE-family HTH domain